MELGLGLRLRLGLGLGLVRLRVRVRVYYVEQVLRDEAARFSVWDILANDVHL